MYSRDALFAVTVIFVEFPSWLGLLSTEIGFARLADIHRLVPIRAPIEKLTDNR